MAKERRSCSKLTEYGCSWVVCDTSRYLSLRSHLSCFALLTFRPFAPGSNWIPADNFLTTITAERYRAWLTLLRDGNQNMVRLWGGGIYEPDVFYDICDGELPVFP